VYPSIYFRQLHPESGYKWTDLEIEVKNGDQREIVQDRPLHLKILISRVIIDSRSTVSYIQITLSELDDYMTSFENVITLNEFLMHQLVALTE